MNRRNFVGFNFVVLFLMDTLMLFLRWCTIELPLEPQSSDRDGLCFCVSCRPTEKEREGWSYNIPALSNGKADADAGSTVCFQEMDYPEQVLRMIISGSFRDVAHEAVVVESLK